MFAGNRKFALVAALTLALVMLLSMAGGAFAGSQSADTVCLDGYVINHREVPVDATKTSTALVVEAVNSSGLTATATVDSNGYFKFNPLPAGDWNFRLQLPEEWDGLAPLADRGGVAETGLTTLDAQDTCYRIVFKIRRLFDLTVIKWEELLDGSVQPGADWQINLTPDGDPYVKAQSDTTDAGGRAAFTLTPGDWVLSEIVKPGWWPVTPSSVKISLDQYAPGGAMDPVVFKNREPVCKSTIVVEKIGFGHDANGNEVQLGALAGWKVTVRPADNSRPPITKYTDGSGKATFDDLPPAVYKVYEEMQPGWESMDDDNVQTVTHMDCETTVVTFRNREIAGDLRIYGQKLFKAWEPPFNLGQAVGLPGWTITATLVGTDVMTTTTTNALGQYEFTADALKAAGMGFPGATIEICEEARDNWIALTSSCVNVKFPYPVPPDYTGAKVNFLNAEEPPSR